MTTSIAITGANGMLGKELVRVARERGLDLVAWTRRDFDITDAEGVRRAVDSAAPATVIHGAAWTDVDGCESDPERAFLVNGRGTRHLVDACRGAGARLVLVSTDYVFSGDAPAPYREDDRPGPLSVYGWSKLVAEEAVRTLGSRGVVARTAWLYADHGHNFLRTMLRLGREKSEIAVVDDQIGSPTFAADLAGGLIGLAGSDAAGTFHVTNSGQVSWNGFARRIFELAALEVSVKAVTSADFPRPAKRPRNSVLAHNRALPAGVPAPPAWEDGLRRCLRRMEEEATAGPGERRDTV